MFSGASVPAASAASRKNRQMIKNFNHLTTDGTKLDRFVVVHVC